MAEVRSGEIEITVARLRLSRLTKIISEARKLPTP